MTIGFDTVSARHELCGGVEAWVNLQQKLRGVLYAHSGEVRIVLQVETHIEILASVRLPVVVICAVAAGATFPFSGRLGTRLIGVGEL